MMPKSAIQRYFSIILIVTLTACGIKVIPVAPTISLTDVHRTAVSVAFRTSVALTVSAMPTLTVGPTNTQDLSSLPTVSFYASTPRVGPSPTFGSTNTPPSFTPAPTRTHAPTHTPLPFVPLEGLRVADDAGSNIYVQDSGKDAIRLTDSGRDSNPILSDDGHEIAFYRGKLQLCVIHTDGTGERMLVSREMLSAFGEVYKSEFIELYEMAFLPGSHQLLFSTWIYRHGGEGHGQRNDDLWFVDADTGILRQLKAPGQGGIFLAAPNGKWIAVETIDHIDVIDIQGQFIHHNLVTNFPAMDDYYGITWASMSWTPNSGELIVLSTYIPPATGITVVRAAWRYPLNGGSGSEIKLDPPPVYDAYAVSPDGNWIVYSCGPEAPIDNSEAIAGIYLGNLHDGTSRLIYTPIADEAGKREVPYDYDEWSPDSVHFIFKDTLDYRMFMGNIHGETVPLGYGVGILGWVDHDHYLFDGGEVIGEVGKQERVNVMGSFPYYEISSSNVNVSFVFLGH